MASLVYEACAILSRIFWNGLPGGMSIEEILSDYEDLAREDILAALGYAARFMRVKRIHRPAA